MGKYTIKDFKKGDTVYHLSNRTLMMVAINIYEESEEVGCRWVDKQGQKQQDTFMAQELGKSADLGPRISVVHL